MDLPSFRPQYPRQRQSSSHRDTHVTTEVRWGAGKHFMKPILETSVDDLRDPLEFSVLGAVTAARAVLEPMLGAGRGSILFTTAGAAINPYPLRAGVGVSFAGEVAYARMLQDELADRAVHVTHTAIGGRIAPDGDHQPDGIAEVLWQHHVERAGFQTRIGIDS